MDKKRKKLLLAAVCVCVLLALGLWLHHRRQPERYARDGLARTYPCLVKLDTGQVGELRVQDMAAEALKETAQFQETGEYSCGFFVVDRFAASITDGEKTSTSVTVPKDGYVLADLYDPDNVQTYDITDGAEYEIRGCTVEVSAGENGLTVTVTKTAPFER